MTSTQVRATQAPGAPPVEDPLVCIYRSILHSNIEETTTTQLLTWLNQIQRVSRYKRVQVRFPNINQPNKRMSESIIWEAL